MSTYDAAGNLLTRGVQQGQSGTHIAVRKLTYSSNTDSGGNTVHPLATSTEYPVAGSTHARLYHGVCL